MIFRYISGPLYSHLFGIISRHRYRDRYYSQVPPQRSLNYKRRLYQVFHCVNSNNNYNYLKQASFQDSIQVPAQSIHPIFYDSLKDDELQQNSLEIEFQELRHNPNTLCLVEDNQGPSDFLPAAVRKQMRKDRVVDV